MEKLTLFEKHFQQAKTEILADIEKGIIPATVKSYYEINDYVDANCYGGFCDENYTISENYGLEIQVQEAVENWLQTRQS